MSISPDDNEIEIEIDDPNHRSIVSYGIEIDTNKIKSSTIVDNEDALAGLGVNAYEQEDFENAIINQVDEAIASEERAFASVAIQKTLQDIDSDISCVEGDLKTLKESVLSLTSLTDYDSRQLLLAQKRQIINKEAQHKRLIARHVQTLKQLEEIKNPQSSNQGSNISSINSHNEDSPPSKLKRPLMINPDLIPKPISYSLTSAPVTSTSTSTHTPSCNRPNEDDDYIPVDNDWRSSTDDEFDDEDEIYGGTGRKRSKPVLRTPYRQKIKNSKSNLSKTSNKKGSLDDGNIDAFHERIRLWQLQQRYPEAQPDDENNLLNEDYEDVSLGSGLLSKGSLWNNLFKYQQAGVKWLIELHKQNVGGIVGDEMGLGKTIQIIAFLACLDYSYQKKQRNERLGPVLIVCPTTVLHQWVKEFHKWWPRLRVAILHDTGSYAGKRDDLIKEIHSCNGVLVTSFSNVRIQKDSLLRYRWHYLILDEGHKIRNPDAEITLSCKQFSTPHRLILSGSPLQNNLKELWSLFDFVFPGRLGTLPVFMTEFSVPITMGGYANATPVQVQTAYKCACVLRDSISPYLLRRMKKDVNSSICLPTKNEQVLFCRLTAEQETQYKKYLASDQVAAILSGRMKIFPGLTMLRKICNHPDLSTPAGSLDYAKKQQEQQQQQQQQQSEVTTSSLHSINNGISVDGYGDWKRSGKMVVVEALLRLWKDQGHRVLLFSQTRQMLDILEKFVRLKDYKYLRMDGTVTIGSRQPAITKYNEDTSIFIFLLTTRVGGLGINLTGANRVIIYDPDWNPSTDMQARERAWRIGQSRHVTIYRLLTTGTIEEKIYHRQIFKQFLTNRILTNPFQRRFFKSNDLYELFTFGDDNKKQQTETGAIFAGTGSEITLRKKNHVKCKQTQERKAEESNSTTRSTSKSHSSTKSKRKRRRQSVQVDGVKISNVDKLVDSRSNNTQESSSNDGNANHKQQDDDILKTLFRKSGVHSALKHDKIVESSTADYVLVEKEAEKVAKQAALALKNSRREVRRSDVGVVTWTGNQGAAGMPTRKKPRFGKKKTQSSASAVETSVNAGDGSSSSSLFSGKELTDVGNNVDSSDLSSGNLLAKMRNRNYYQKDSSSAVPTETEYDGLLRDMRSFISHQAQVQGQATTQEILNKFRTRVPTDKSTVFREMLKEICEFKKSRGEGVWKLKDEFK